MDPKDVIGQARGFAEVIGDPVLIVLLVVILAQLFLIYYLFRISNKRNVLYDDALNSLSKELHESGQTLVKLTTLIEVLVHGK